MAKKKVVKKIIKRKVLKKKVPKGGAVKKVTKKTVKKSPSSNTKTTNKSKRPKPKVRDPEKAGVIHIDDMYSSWFIDYASYVILERAVPSLNDGLKPVQRRILHSLKEKDDGRYNKVANVVGHTMQYHPHGDASIADALVAMGQKNLLIDTQGNWGNILTGDKAAATRYIEARLSKFALAVTFNSKTTNWAASYDGRNQEPVNLPLKFPLLLAHGAEGIAVGLACKILPHNFNELIDGCIDVLRKKRTKLMPDFPTGGIMDASEYNGGLRGGKVRVRARIEKTKNKRLLRITEIPFGTTAGGLMDNIVSANEKGKIKISKIEDITAEKVEINVHLPVGLDPDTAIEALFAFTDCEVTISPNSCVIEDDKPRFYTVDDLLKKSSLRTRDLLKWELEIKLGELEDKWHHSSLERIFIENKIYRRIEECTTWESVVEEIWKGLKPYLKKLRRKVVEEDVVKLTEIKIKRISKYDSFKADELIKGIEDKIKEVKRDISQITRYTIRYYKELKEKFGKGRERKTEVSSFSKVIAKNVAVATETIYLNSKTGFAGWGLKSSGVSVDRCSRMDDLIVFGREGTMQVSKVAEKTYVGKNPAHVAIFKKDEPKYYCMIYRDGRDGATLVKRFTVQGVTREKMYDLTKGNNGTRVLFFSAHESDKETPVVNVVLKPAPRLRVKEFEVNFADVSIKGRASKGNILTKNKVDKVVRKKGQLELL